MFQFLYKLFNPKINEDIPENKGFIDEKDNRTFGSSSFYKISKKDLPSKGSSVIIYEPKVKDQFDTDFCVGFSGSYVREATEGKPMSGEFAFAMAKKQANSIKGWGTSLLKICKGLVEYGIPEQELWQIKKKQRRNKYANWKNITKKTYDNALKHKAQSYFQLEQGRGMDLFDSIIAYLNAYKGEKLLVMTGSDAHAITSIGWQDYAKIKEKLICKDSYDRPYMKYRIGKYEAGTGRRYFTRQEVNSSFFTCYMLHDMPRDLAGILNVYKGKAVKGISDKVYLIKNGKKHHIQDEETAWVNLISIWHDIEPILQTELDKIPEGKPITFKESPEKMRRLITEIVNSPKILERYRNAKH